MSLLVPIRRLHSFAAVLFMSGRALLLISVGEVALAQPPASPESEPSELAIWAGYGDSDNVGRTPIPEEGTYRSVGIFAGLEHVSPRLDAEIDSDLEYRAYSEEALDNETIGTLDAHALVDMVADRFAWNFAGTLNQGQQDPFAARGPNNRETIKVLTTGPRLDVPFGRTNLGFSAMRSARRFDESTQIDNDSDSYEVALSRQARPRLNLALVANTSETTYVDSPLLMPYDIDQFFVRMNRTLSGGTLSADLGTNKIASGQQNSQNPLLDVTWDGSLGTRSRLRVSSSRQFMDSGTYQGATGDTLVTTDPFEQERLEIAYRLTLDRTIATLGALIGQDDYAGESPLDNDNQSINATLEHRFSSRISVGIRYLLYERDYGAGTGSTAEDRTRGMWASCNVGRHLTIGVSVSRFESEGLQQVDETRKEVRLAYGPRGEVSRAFASIGR
jgi:hypothetical protein